MPLTFLGLDDPEGRSRFVVLPVPHGAARQGPHALLLASARLDRHDEEAKGEPCEAGVFTDSPVEDDDLQREVARHLDAGRLPIVVGGDATISAGTAAACESRVKNLSVLRVAARAWAAPVPRVVQVGVRTGSAIGRTFFMPRFPVAQVLKSLTSSVFLSIDLEGLDPSVVPAVGSPVPGGLLWYDALDLVRAVAQSRRIVAADVVGLRPVAGDGVSESAAARLVYKIIAYTWARKRT